MDTVIFEEFKGTGNAELKLDRKLADKRIFPAVDVDASGTRKEEILLAPDELAIVIKLRRVLHALDPQQALELLLDKLKQDPDQRRVPACRSRRRRLGAAATDEDDRPAGGLPSRRETGRPAPVGRSDLAWHTGPPVRFTPASTARPGDLRHEEATMKPDIHPDVRRDHGDLHLRQHVHHPQHRADRR